MKALVAVLVSAVFVPFAFATAPRTFVSSTGLDTNPCSRTAPCRSFSAALAQTSAGGSIVVLDSAGYGPVTISQSVSIISPQGIYAGVTSTMSDAIEITGTAASDVIVLQGLSLEGPGGLGLSGVYVNNVTSLDALYILRCDISGFANGIVYAPANGSSSLTVTDTVLHDNFSAGIAHQSTGHVLLNRCHIAHSSIAVWMAAAALATIENSVIERGSSAALLANTGEQVTVDHCVLTFSGTGIVSVGNATVNVANSAITDNTTGISTGTGGTVLSRIGDGAFPIKTNTLLNNTTNGSFSGTFTAQ